MCTVAEFLIERLITAGVKQVFGLPGDYVLNFYDKLSKNKDIKLINTTDEASAGFAADGCARVSGIGCVCVTYSVGGLKLINSIAGAYAEKSPVIVISGSPGMKERGEKMILHHVAGSFESQREVFKNYTCATAFLSNSYSAGYEIDRVIDALKYYKQPIYIELPRDIADKPINYDAYRTGTPLLPVSDEENLEEALNEARQWLAKAEKPVIIAGVEVSRYGLGKKLIEFAEVANIPVCTTLLSKSVIRETHPLFAGIFMGNSSVEFTKNLINNSDCLLMFGVMLTDMALSFNPKVFNRRKSITASVRELKISNHSYTEILFKDFCDKLFSEKEKIPRVPREKLEIPNRTKSIFEAQPVKLTVNRFFQAIDSILGDNMAVISDIGDALFGASDLLVHHSNHFLSPAFYTSMGFAIPAALGVQMSKPGIRPLVIVGDGAFQMSFGEISTMIRYKLNPIIFVLNNGGYTTERYLKDGSYNDIHNWHYTEVVKLFGGGSSFLCKDEPGLKDVLSLALNSKELVLIEVILDKMDISLPLKRMTDGLSKRL